MLWLQPRHFSSLQETDRFWPSACLALPRPLPALHCDAAARATRIRYILNRGSSTKLARGLSRRKRHAAIHNHRDGTISPRHSWLTRLDPQPFLLQTSFRATGSPCGLPATAAMTSPGSFAVVALLIFVLHVASMSAALPDFSQAMAPPDHVQPPPPLSHVCLSACRLTARCTFLTPVSSPVSARRAAHLAPLHGHRRLWRLGAVRADARHV